VGAAATRTLTAGTNIVLAKDTGVTGFNDLDAAGVAGAVWDAATATYGGAGTYGELLEAFEVPEFPAFPANFASLVISAAGAVDANVVKVQGNDPAATTDVEFDEGTVSVGTSTTAFTATGASLNATTGAYRSPQCVLFQSGVLKGERRQIASHTVSGSDHTFTFDAAKPFSAAPGAGDTFVVG
jgi:hypothetical protein